MTHFLCECRDGKCRRQDYNKLFWIFKKSSIFSKAGLENADSNFFIKRTHQLGPPGYLCLKKRTSDWPSGYLIQVLPLKSWL